MPSRLLQQVLAELFAKHPQTAEERAAINAAIAEISRALLGHGLPAADRPTDEPPSRQTDRNTLSKYSPFYGLGLREACPKQLSLAAKPQYPREIWEALKAEGYKTAHSDPVHSVNDALRRRAKTHGDVLLVGEGKWGRKDWFTEEQLEEIQKSIGGMGGRDRAAHSERTKSGMIVAMERGAKPGHPRKLTPEKIHQVEEMIRAGSSVHDAAKQIGVVAGTIYNNFGRDRLRALRAERAKQENTENTGSGPEETEETRH